MREKLIALAGILGLTLGGAAVLALGVGGVMTAVASPMASTQPPSPIESLDNTDLAELPTEVEATDQASSDLHWNDTDPEQTKFNNLYDECMAEKGYQPSLMAAWRAQNFKIPYAERPWTITPPEERQAFEYAMWGDSGTEATDTYEGLVAHGGCDGYVVGQLYPKEDH